MDNEVLRNEFQHFYDRLTESVRLNFKEGREFVGEMEQNQIVGALKFARQLELITVQEFTDFLNDIYEVE